jgi:hypothetical protein
MPDLSVVRQRLIQAGHHARSLDELVAAFAAGPPYTRESSLTERGTVLERVELVRQPPPVVALTLSDAVHQLRAALDNMVGALRPGGPTDKSQFVIAPTAERFEERARVELEGLSPDHVEAIRRIQPYSDKPWKFVGSTLTQIHDLARTDRHRAPLLQAAIVEPHYAEGEIVEWRGARDGSWVTTEYEPGKLHAVHYKVEVRIAEAVEGAQGHEVTGMVGWFLRELTWIVEALERGTFLGMTGGPR